MVRHGSQDQRKIETGEIRKIATETVSALEVQKMADMNKFLSGTTGKVTALGAGSISILGVVFYLGQMMGDVKNRLDVLITDVKEIKIEQVKKADEIRCEVDKKITELKAGLVDHENRIRAVERSSWKGGANEGSGGSGVRAGVIDLSR
jgi:hypothetical protein